MKCRATKVFFFLVLAETAFLLTHVLLSQKSVVGRSSVGSVHGVSGGYTPDFCFIHGIEHFDSIACMRLISSLSVLCFTESAQCAYMEDMNTCMSFGYDS
jgi:hypothetical protein